MQAISPSGDPASGCGMTILEGQKRLFFYPHGVLNSAPYMLEEKVFGVRCFGMAESCVKCSPSIIFVVPRHRVITGMFASFIAVGIQS